MEWIGSSTNRTGAGLSQRRSGHSLKNSMIVATKKSKPDGKRTHPELFFHGDLIQVAHRMFMEEEDDVFMFTRVVPDKPRFQINPP